MGANIARQESTRTNSGASTRELLFETTASSGQIFQEAWSSDAAKGIALAAGVPYDGVNSLVQRMRAFVQTYSQVALADGTPANELRKWRENIFANYDFSSGLLDGFGIGGAIRYQSAIAVGLPIVSFEFDGSASDGVDKVNDFQSFDVTNPIMDQTETHYDMWVSYSSPILNDRVLMKWQFNGRNLFENSHLIPVRVQPNGSANVSRISQPTTYTLSTKFEFRSNSLDHPYEAYFSYIRILVRPTHFRYDD